eukprot:g18816.t1
MCGINASSEPDTYMDLDEVCHNLGITEDKFWELAEVDLQQKTEFITPLRVVLPPVQTPVESQLLHAEPEGGLSADDDSKTHETLLWTAPFPPTKLSAESSQLLMDFDNDFTTLLKLTGAAAATEASSAHMDDGRNFVQEDAEKKKIAVDIAAYDGTLAAVHPKTALVPEAGVSKEDCGPNRGLQSGSGNDEVAAGADTEGLVEDEDKAAITMEEEAAPASAVNDASAEQNTARAATLVTDTIAAATATAVKNVSPLGNATKTKGGDAVTSRRAPTVQGRLSREAEWCRLMMHRRYDLQPAWICRQGLHSRNLPGHHLENKARKRAPFPKTMRSYGVGAMTKYKNSCKRIVTARAEPVFTPENTQTRKQLDPETKE